MQRNENYKNEPTENCKTKKDKKRSENFEVKSGWAEEIVCEPKTRSVEITALENQTKKIFKKSLEHH